jgi:hypothetical protein
VVDGTAASLLDGTFFFTPDLDPGSYTVRARAKDIVLDVLGNWASISITVQQLAPPVLTELELFDDTGTSSTDLITSNATVAGSVTHDLGAGFRTVEFDWDGDLVADGETLTGADGTFAFLPTGLDLGSVTVSARTAIYDERSGEMLTSNWTNLTFTLESRTGATIDTFDLANDTGTSGTDNITTDPTVSGTIVSDGPVAYVLIEFDVNDDGLVDGSTRTNEVGEFSYRPEGLAYGAVTVQARAADWDPPSGDFLISDWEPLAFTFEEGSSAEPPPPPGSEEAIDQAGAVADVIGGGYRAGVDDAVDAYNDAIGSSVGTAGQVDLHIASYVSSSGTHAGGVPGFGSFGYESGAYAAGGGGSPISFGGPVVPTASSYSDTITVSESGGGITVSGTLIASSVVTVNSLLQTFVIDVDLSYSYTRTEVNGYTSVVTGWWEFHFYASGSWTDIGGVIEVIGTYTVDEDGGHTASYDKTTPYSFSGPDGTQNGTLTDTASSSFSFSHGETGGSFSIDQTGVYGGAGFVRTETSSHSLSHNDSSTYTASGPGASRSGSLDYWYISDYGLTQGESGSYDLTGFTAAYDVDSFARDENGTYESSDSDSASYTVQFLDGEVEGNFSIRDSLSYSYSRHEEGDFQNGGATVNVTLFTHDESGTNNLSQSASASYTVSQTNYTDNASYTLVDVEGGGFTYHAEGNYTVTGGAANVTGTSFSLSSSATNSYEFDGSGSYSQSTALEDRQGPYSLSHSTSSSTGLNDSGSFAINGSGLSVDGVTNQTSTLSATFTSSSSASYSNSLSAGNVTDQQSGWYSTSYVDSMDYTAGGAFSATGGYTLDQQSYAVTTVDGDYSYTRSQSFGDVVHNENGTHSASFHDSGSYTVSGSAVDKTGTFTLTEIDDSTNEQTNTASYTKIATPTTTSGTLTATHSGSTSSSFVDSGTYTNASVSGSFTHDKILITEAHLDDDGIETTPSRTTDFTKNDDSTVSSSYHYTGNYTEWTASRTNNGDFTLDEKEDTTATYSGSYGYDEASSSGLIRVQTTDTVASTLSESGTYSRGTEGESRSASFSLHQLSNGTNSSSDSGTYTDTTGGTYRGLSESDTSITLDEDGSYSFSPSSAESRSYSFSQTTTAETTNDSGETRPFTNTTAYGTKTETVTGSKTSTQTETGTYTRASTINTRSASFTMTEDGEATTSISQAGTYNNGDIGTYTDTTKTVVNSSLSENGTLTNNAGTESRSATFTETKDTTTDVSYTTNYTFIEIDSEGIAIGTYDQNNNSHKEASQSDNGSYTRTASGESRTATRVLTEDTDFDSTFTREGTAIHSEGTDDFKTTQDGIGNESYSESGSYTKTPTVDTSGGTFSRDKWNMEDVTKDVTTTYSLDLGDSATKSGTRKKKEETFRIFTGDESGTFTISGGSVTRSGTFSDFETSDTDATITDSGSMTAPANSGSASFSESQTSTQNVDIQQTGTFNETPTNNSRSYSFDYDRSASSSSSFSESGTGAGTASSSSSGYYGGYGGNYLGYHWIWSNYVGYGGGGTGTKHLQRTENGERSSSYHEDGNATTSGGETISSSASYTETDSSKSRRSISSSTSSSYSNSNSYTDHTHVSSGSGIDKGTESFTETYSYSATGTVTISRGTGGGGGSGSGSSSGGLGEMTRSLSGSFSHSEWDESRESYSGSYSGSTSSSATDGGTFSGQGSHSDTETNFDSSSYRETGSFTQTIVGEGGGSSSGSGGDYDTMNSSHTNITSASHSFSGSGGGTASGIGVGSGSGSGSGSSWGPPTFNHNWNGTQTNSLSHSYSTSGTTDDDRIAGTTNNSGNYSEQSFSAYSSSHHDDGSESAYGSNHNWINESSGSLTTTYTDNGSYAADGTSAGTEMNDDYGGNGWSTYHNYNGTATSSSSYTPNTSDPQTTAYPAEDPSNGSSDPDEEGSSWLDWVQTGLDIVGFVDPFGIADGVNAVIHLARGNYVDAAISAAGMIPYVGDAAKAAKYAAKGVKAGVKLATAGAKVGAKAAGKAASAVADVARKGAKLADNAVRGAAATAKKALNKAGDLANSVACNLGLKNACFVGDTHVLIIDDEGLLADISIASGAEDEATMPPWAASVFWLGLGVGGYLVLNRKKRRAEAGLSPEDVDRWLAARTDDLPVWLEPDEALQEALAFEEPSWGHACTAAAGELVVAGSAWSRDEMWDEASIATASDVATVCQKRPSSSAANVSCGSTPDPWDRPLADSLVEDGRELLFDWRNERPWSTGPSIEDSQWPDATETADLDSAGTSPEVDAAELPTNKGVRPMNNKSIGAPLPASFVRRCLAGAWLVVCLGAAALWMGWPNDGPSQSANSRAVAQPVAAGRPSTPAYRSIPIRDVQVGQRVPAHNPEMTDDDRDLAPVFEQLAWKKLTLESVKDDGSLVKMELLRPDEWVREEQVQVGHSIELDLMEFGADGPATILGIEDAPPVKPGPGSVVTGKFVHESAQVLDLTIEELDSPIGTTATHPFWSQDRKAFIPAMELVAGERLGTLDGATLRLTSITPRAGPETVYNLEVNVEHVFYVSSRGLLVHNYCKWTDQGIYVLYEMQNGIKKVVYVGRGDVLARKAKHAADPDKAKYLFETIIAGNLKKANAKGIEQGLIEKFGGAVSMNNGKINQLVNKIRSYVSGNPNYAAYEAAKNTKTQAALNLLKQKGFDVPP